MLGVALAVEDEAFVDGMNFGCCCAGLETPLNKLQNIRRCSSMRMTGELSRFSDEPAINRSPALNVEGDYDEAWPVSSNPKMLSCELLGPMKTLTRETSVLPLVLRLSSSPALG